jgi:hypothetical protein
MVGKSIANASAIDLYFEIVFVALMLLDESVHISKGGCSRRESLDFKCDSVHGGIVSRQ